VLGVTVRVPKRLRFEAMNPIGLPGRTVLDERGALPALTRRRLGG